MGEHDDKIRAAMRARPRPNPSVPSTGGLGFGSLSAEARQSLYSLAVTVAILAALTCAFYLGRTTVEQPRPEVYVVRQDELTTTTSVP